MLMRARVDGQVLGLVMASLTIDLPFLRFGNRVLAARYKASIYVGSVFAVVNLIFLSPKHPLNNDKCIHVVSTREQ